MCARCLACGLTWFPVCCISPLTRFRRLSFCDMFVTVSAFRTFASAIPFGRHNGRCAGRSEGRRPGWEPDRFCDSVSLCVRKRFRVSHIRSAIPAGRHSGRCAVRSESLRPGRELSAALPLQGPPSCGVCTRTRTA